jgi:PKD repeat protein
LINQPIEFDGSGSSAPGGTIISYAWDFGDGATGTGTKPAHVYAAGDVYIITLTVTDDDGYSSTCMTTAIAYSEEGFPHCDAGGPYSGAINQMIQFDGTRSNVPEGGHIMVYAWDFGDGTTATGAIPQHAYASAASYTVTLIVYDGAQRKSACTSYADISPLAVEPATWGRIKSKYR